MRQCDHPPCQSDGRFYEGDKAYCLRHVHPPKRTVPRVKKKAAAKGPVDRGGNPISERKPRAKKSDR